MPRIPLPKGMPLPPGFGDIKPTVQPEAYTPAPSPPKPRMAIGGDDTSLIMHRTLSPEHRSDLKVMKFIASYVVCRDTKQAAQEAGIHIASAHALKRKPDINECISQITELAVEKFGYDASEIVERVKEVVRIDPADFENPDGSFKTSLRQIPPEARRAVKKFKCKNIYQKDPNGMDVVVGQLIEVELYDKLKGVELLGREKEIFTEKREIKHEIGANMRNTLLESVNRANERVQTLKDVGEQARLTGRTPQEVIDVGGDEDHE